MKNAMTKSQFDSACKYANDGLDPYEVDMALEYMEEWRCPLYMASEKIQSHIAEKMNEWCVDHDIKQDAWRMHGDEEDVFFNDGN